jgi:hypothetical protein
MYSPGEEMIAYAVKQWESDRKVASMIRLPAGIKAPRIETHLPFTMHSHVKEVDTFKMEMQKSYTSLAGKLDVNGLIKAIKSKDGLSVVKGLKCKDIVTEIKTLLNTGLRKSLLELKDLVSKPMRKGWLTGDYALYDPVAGKRSLGDILDKIAYVQNGLVKLRFLFLRSMVNCSEEELDLNDWLPGAQHAMGVSSARTTAGIMAYAKTATLARSTLFLLLAGLFQDSAKDKGHTPAQVLYLALRRLKKMDDDSKDANKKAVFHLLAMAYETIARGGAAVEAYTGAEKFGNEVLVCDNWPKVDDQFSVIYAEENGVSPPKDVSTRTRKVRPL